MTHRSDHPKPENGPSHLRASHETAVLTIRGPREQVEIINDLLNPDSYQGVTSSLTIGKSTDDA